MALKIKPAATAERYCRIQRFPNTTCWVPGESRGLPMVSAHPLLSGTISLGGISIGRFGLREAQEKFQVGVGVSGGDSSQGCWACWRPVPGARLPKVWLTAGSPTHRSSPRMASVSELTVRVQPPPQSWAPWEGWSSPQEAEKMLTRNSEGSYSWGAGD